ncbi:MAG TPA: (2Fe-2S)-binding protein [Actinoplanes sp.]|nr:(2Fe-2S)-binding protein [Actinoplanes sp.]
MSSADGALRAAAAVGPYFTWEPWPAGSDRRPLNPGVGGSRPLAGAESRPVTDPAGGGRLLTDLTGAESRPVTDPARARRQPLTDSTGGGSRPVTDPAGARWRPATDSTGGGSRPVTDPAGAGWRPLTDLTDGEVVAERVDAARRALASMFGLAEDAVQPRVAASVTFLGLASRLLSPPLGALVLAGTLPTPGADQLWWKPAAGGPWPFVYGTIAGVPGDGASLVATTVNGLVAPVLRAFQERFVLSPQVLWGNVASALAGAAGMLADAHPDDPAASAGDRTIGRSAVNDAIGAIGVGDPDRVDRAAVKGRDAIGVGDLDRIGRAGAADRDAIDRAGVAERAGDIVAQALSLPPLAGTGTLVRPDPRHPRRFLVRHNCCLYYRIPGGGTCGDCVLTPEPDRRRHWQSVLAARST